MTLPGLTKFTKLPDLLEPYEYLKLVREDSGYPAQAVADYLEISLGTFGTWEERGVKDKVKRKAWRAALVIMCENRRKACSRHVARMTTIDLEEK